MNYQKFERDIENLIIEGVGFDLNKTEPAGVYIDIETRILYEGWKLQREKLDKALHYMNMAIFQFEMGRDMRHPIESFKKFIEENK